MFAWTFTSAIEPDRPARSSGTAGSAPSGAVFRAAPRFWQFLLALLLVWTGFNAAWNFIAPEDRAGGGGPLLVGIGDGARRARRGAGDAGVLAAGTTVGAPARVRRRAAPSYALGFLLWGLIEDPTDRVRC